MNEKNIVLVITEGKDYSIKQVSDWLSYYSKKHSFKLIVLDVSKQSLEIKGGKIDCQSDLVFGINGEECDFRLSEIKGIFIRQARIRIKNHTGAKANPESVFDLKTRFYNYLMAYESTVRWLVLNCFGKVNIIGYDAGGFINKLDVLKTAAETGLVIPDTILVSNKNDLISFHKKHPELIVKSLGVGLNFIDKKNTLEYKQLSRLITSKEISSIPNEFNLSLVQNRVEKLFEIRVFYLDDSCYSWALLSQSNDQTTVDYRNYDWDNPMRVVPFKLPEDIEQKIRNLMEKLGLRTGSIDLMYSTSGQYVFLEINPSGQYGYNSDSGNYDLDKKIAESLIKNNERKKYRTFHS